MVMVMMTMTTTTTMMTRPGQPLREGADEEAFDLTEWSIKLRPDKVPLAPALSLSSLTRSLAHSLTRSLEHKAAAR